MLAVITLTIKLQPYEILQCKIKLKEKLSTVITVRYQNQE